MSTQRKTDPRQIGSITLPDHIPLTFPDIYYYINYEANRTRTAPLHPKEKWQAVTIAFIKYNNRCPPCFGEYISEDAEECV